MKKTPEKFLSVEQARRLIAKGVAPLRTVEKVGLRGALGRICGADIISPFAVPGHDNSAMDGLAARVSDLRADRQAALRIVGEAFAGRPYCGAALRRGECVRIMTGAAIPRGADAVVPQEQAEIQNKRALIYPANHRRHQHLRFAGEDIKKGETAIAAGVLLRPAHIGLLASLGVIEVPVYRRLRVAFFSTGDELRTLGESLSQGEIYDSNRYTLLSMIKRMNFTALDFGAIADDPAALAAAVDAAAAGADAVITSGGVSVGEADYVRDILGKRGKVLFWKVAMKPGRPLAYGKLKGGVDFFGLPGNPVSVMVCFYQFVREALWRRAGRCGDLTPPMFYAKCATPLKKAPGRAEFQRGVLNYDESGEPVVSATGAQGSGMLTSMTAANCLIVLPEKSAGAKPGDRVPVQMFEGLI